MSHSEFSALWQVLEIPWDLLSMWCVSDLWLCFCLFDSQTLGLWPERNAAVLNIFVFSAELAVHVCSCLNILILVQFLWCSSPGMCLNREKQKWFSVCNRTPDLVFNCLQVDVFFYFSLPYAQSSTPQVGTLSALPATSRSNTTEAGTMGASPTQTSPGCPGVPPHQTLTKTESGDIVCYLACCSFISSQLWL